MSASERMRRYRAKRRASKAAAKPLTITKQDAAEIVAMWNELILARKALVQLADARDTARRAKDKVQLRVTLYNLLSAYAQARKRRTRGKK
jgi:hypothetical protein